jgi:hypothetical protein
MVRERVQRGRDIVLAQARTLIAAVLAERGAEIDVELAARTLLAAAEEGARLLLERPDEFPAERLTAYVSDLLALVS